MPPNHSLSLPLLVWVCVLIPANPCLPKGWRTDNCFYDSMNSTTPRSVLHIYYNYINFGKRFFHSKLWFRTRIALSEVTSPYLWLVFRHFHPFGTETWHHQPHNQASCIKIIAKNNPHHALSKFMVFVLGHVHSHTGVYTDQGIGWLDFKSHHACLHSEFRNTHCTRLSGGLNEIKDLTSNQCSVLFCVTVVSP